MSEYIERDSAVNGLIQGVRLGIITTLNDAKEYFQKLHAADVEPVRHGRWIIRGGRLYCSECKQRACVTRDMEDFWYTVGTPYCPNCGAKMDKEE